MNPHQIYGKMIIASGEDGGEFVYEPSWKHTPHSFNERMKKRMAEARKDQDAFAGMEERSNGSVNVEPQSPWTRQAQGLLPYVIPSGPYTTLDADRPALPAPKKSCVELPQAYTHYGD